MIFSKETQDVVGVGVNRIGKESLMNSCRLFEILTARSQVNHAVGVQVYFAEQGWTLRIPFGNSTVNSWSCSESGGYEERECSIRAHRARAFRVCADGSRNRYLGCYLPDIAGIPRMLLLLVLHKEILAFEVGCLSRAEDLIALQADSIFHGSVLPDSFRAARQRRRLAVRGPMGSWAPLITSPSGLSA